MVSVISPRPLRVLVVEDHAPCAQLMKITLLGAGHEVFIARTLRRALAAVADELFDTLICDLLLPDGNGIAVIRAVRKKDAAQKKDASIFAIAVSALPREVCERESIEAGFDRFLSKPFLPCELIALLV